MFIPHHVSHVRCQVSGVRCQVLLVICHVSGIVCLYQTVKARDMTFWEYDHFPPSATCHMSYVMCQVSHKQNYMYIYIFSPTQPSGPSWSSSRHVCLSVCLCVCLMSPSHAIFFEAFHWHSGHMISLRPLIGQPSFTTKLSTPMPKSPLAAAATTAVGRDKKKA